MTEADRDRILYDAWKAGDTTARGKLITRLMGIARKVANRYSLDIRDDVMSEAMVGVCEAVDDWEGGGTIGLFAWYRAHSRSVDFLRKSDKQRVNTVSIYAYSATELIEEWRSSGMQEENALIGEVRAIAKALLPPAELDVIFLRARDMSGPAIAKRLGTDRFRVSERESSAMAKLTAAVEDD